RLFIIQHDCGHAAFFKSKRANHIVGAICSTMVCTPYRAWNRDHAKHHASSGNLDERGIGDIWTLTVDEYLALPPFKRLRYRLYRHPLILFGFGPAFLFLILHRFTGGSPTTREFRSVHLTNLAILLVLLIASFTIGLKAFLMVQLPILFITCSTGVWMFYVQHQFEGVSWARKEEWDYLAQALDGSSYYKLPKLLQWFTGNIGFHHIHHLSSRIPNYLLEKCHSENSLFRNVPEINWQQSLKSMQLHLWDEENRELVGFGFLKQYAPAKTG
ncbi:MAG: fatty acid desaturase, partial [Verrucomicrobiota bacterium]